MNQGGFLEMIDGCDENRGLAADVVEAKRFKQMFAIHHLLN